MTTQKTPKATDIYDLLATHLEKVMHPYCGYICLGMMFSYPIHQFLRDEFKLVPGLWITGKMGTGKTTISEWLLDLYGQAQHHYPAHSCTNNFLQKQLCNNPGLPIGIDCIDPRTRIVNCLLKNATDSSSIQKATHNLGKSIITFKTVPLVNGERPPSDAALASRYVIVRTRTHPAKHNTITAFKKVEELKHQFPVLTGYLALHHESFAKKFKINLEEWFNNKKVQESIPKERSRFVPGVAYASWLAATQVLYPQNPKLMDRHLPHKKMVHQQCINLTA